MSSEKVVKEWCEECQGEKRKAKSLTYYSDIRQKTIKTSVYEDCKACNAKGFTELKLEPCEGDGNPFYDYYRIANGTELKGI